MMEVHIDQLRVKSRLSLIAYVKGIKEINEVKKINFIYLSDRVFDHVVQGLLCSDGVYGIEPIENIIGKKIEGVYCKIVKGLDWDVEQLEALILEGEINIINPKESYTRVRNNYRKRENG